MLQAFVFERVAVVVFPWNEPIDPPERGTRVEVRLLADEPHRGSYAAAQRFVIDDPVFRADLFDQTTYAARQPAQRALPFALRRGRAHRPDLARRDQDRPDRLARGRAERPPAPPHAPNVDGVDPAAVERDAAALRDAIPAIVAVVEATWDSVRSAPV